MQEQFVPEDRGESSASANFLPRSASLGLESEFEVGNWKLEIRNWKLEIRKSKFETRNSKIAAKRFPFCPRA
jgi:hypothetical protein